jgi:hypothetical protein
VTQLTKDLEMTTKTKTDTKAKALQIWITKAERFASKLAEVAGHPEGEGSQEQARVNAVYRATYLAATQGS